MDEQQFQAVPSAEGSRERRGLRISRGNGYRQPGPRVRLREDAQRAKPKGIEQYYPAIRKVMEGGFVTSITLLATIVALFLKDIFEASFTKEVDEAVMWILFGTFVIFVLELLIMTTVDPDNRFGFFWWLDLVAALSLIADIDFLVESIDSLILGGSLSLARAGRAARAGTRAGRILRLFRVVRMMRIIKLFSVVTKQREHRDQKAELDDDQLKPSRVGKELSERVTRKVIFGVLFLLLVVPLTDQSEPFDLQSEYMTQFALRDMSGSTSEAAFESSLQAFIDSTDPDTDLDMPIALLRVVWGNGTTVECAQEPDWDALLCQEVVDLQFHFRHPDEYLRASELVSVWDDVCTNDLFHYSSERCVLACGEVSDDEVAAVLAGEVSCEYSDFDCVYDEGCASFVVFDNTSDAREAALLNTILTIFIIVLLGLASYLFTRDATKLFIRPIERMMAIVHHLETKPLEVIEPTAEGEEGGSETQLLEAALTKISSLLQIGFGEAGAEIIANNMSLSGDFDPMIKGKKVRAIFGFCDIRQFTSTTECLQEDVLLFVNKIAEIVHTRVQVNFGAPNKNIGDAFLLVWKLPVLSDEVTAMADAALRSFLEIIRSIKVDKGLRELTQHPMLSGRISNYTVRLGFGLHAGWAIEGAIGSKRKIDPSYLSIHVDFSAALEAATKQYGVELLLSQDVHMMLSDEMKAGCRRVDRVTVPSFSKPQSLYTYDLLVEHTDSGADETPIPPVAIPSGFRTLFDSGVNHYVAGEWVKARAVFQQCLSEREDPPSSSLLAFMEKTDFVPPTGWKGCRDL
eukprot:Rmarinus@m.23158